MTAFLTTHLPGTIDFLAGWAVCYWTNRYLNRRAAHAEQEEIARQEAVEQNRGQGSRTSDFSSFTDG